MNKLEVVTHRITYWVKSNKSYFGPFDGFRVKQKTLIA